MFISRIVYLYIFSGCIIISCAGYEESVETGQTSVPAALHSEEHFFILDTLASGLEVPWAIDWLPDGRAVISERRNGRISIFDFQNGQSDTLQGVPRVYAKADGGMLDICVHPGFSENRLLYFAYSIHRPDSSSTTVVDRARLVGKQLTDRERLFTALPYYRSDNHYGCRLLIEDGYLFISMGDRLLNEKWRMRCLSQGPDGFIYLGVDEGMILRLRPPDPL